MAKPDVSNDQILKNLTTSFSDHAPRTWFRNPLTYSIPETSPIGSSNESSGFVKMTSHQVLFAEQAFELWDDLIAISLNRVSSNKANIMLAYSSTTDPGGKKPDGTVIAGSYTHVENKGDIDGVNVLNLARIWMATSWDENKDASIGVGSLGVLHYLHEIGHSLGLSHPGLYNATDKKAPTYEANATYSRDTLQYTIMSYFDEGEDGSGANWKGVRPSTPMIDDIMAIQTKYGADTSTRDGNTTYGFHARGLNRSIYDFTKNSDPVLTIWDGGGTDTLNVSGYSQKQVIDLRAGHYSSVGDLTQNVGIAYNVTIENAVGGSGSDFILGNDANNRLTGSLGNDTLQGGKGEDVLVGGVGNDIYNLFDMANGKYDTVIEASDSGNDMILLRDLHGKFRTYVLGSNIERGAIVGADASGFGLFGNEKNNELFDDAGGNELLGQDGNDTLDGGAGMDTLQGGEDNDTYHLYDVTSGKYDRVIEIAGAGIDTVLVKDKHGSVRAYTLTAQVENGQIIGFDAAGFSLHGNDLNNKLYDDRGGNSLFGEGGNDTLSGGAGNDTLFGGAGNDRMFGGTGSDTYWVDDAGDKVFEDEGAGVRDLVNVTRSSYTLTDNVENLTYQGAMTAAFNGVGNELDNTIIGWNGSDTLNGMGGADTMIGKAGDDTYTVDNAGDVIIDSSGAHDRVNSLRTSYTLGAGIEELNYLGSDHTAKFTGTGNGLDNLIIGWNGDDTLDGKGGNDTLDGRLGNDTYWVDSFGDVVKDSGGERDRINTTLTTYTLSGGIEELNYVGPNTSDFTGYGNELDNRIIGWSGNDWLYGLAGHDTLEGKSGSDVYNLFDVTNGEYDTVIEDKNAVGSDIILVRDLHGSVREYTMAANVERGAIIGHDASGFTLHGNDSNNQMFDDIGDNVLYGEGGDDTLDGGDGQDILVGGADDDVYILNDRSGGAYDLVSEDGSVNGGTRDRIDLMAIHVGGSPDSYLMPANVEIGNILGTADFSLVGNSGNNILTGNSGINSLFGNSGNDVLDGGVGPDTLTGGDNSDAFVFSTALVGSNVDVITDFNVAEDSIWLDHDIFTQAGSVGALSSSAFVLSTSNASSTQRIIYDAPTGRIFYDSDGFGGQGPLLFAFVTPNTALTAADFTIVA